MKLLKMGMVLFIWFVMMQSSPARMGMSLDQCKKIYGEVVESTLVRSQITDGHKEYKFKKTWKHLYMIIRLSY